MNISFVIPAYNAVATLEESVESIYKGNFSPGDEIIIINDASSDATPDIIRKLQENHPEIIMIDNEANKGCPASRNVGIRRAKNDLIFNLDSDNVLAPASIPKLKQFLIDNNADIAAFGEYHYFKDTTDKITHKWICNPGLFTLSDLLAGNINPGPGGNYLYTKASWEKIGGYSEYGKGLHEAWGFTLKQLANGAKFFVMPGGFYYHRYGHSSLFVRESSKLHESSRMASLMLEPHLDLIEDEDRAYIATPPHSLTWYDLLDKKGIRVKGKPLGKNGKLVYTNPIKNFLYGIKKIVKKH